MATCRISEKSRGPGATFAPMLEAVLVLAAAVADVFRPRWSLLADIALLRHQLTVLQRSVARPRVTRFDRIALVALAAVTPTLRNVLRIVQPETLLRWHRAGFRLSGGGGAEHAPRRASLQRRPLWSGPWPRRTDSGVPRGSVENCSSSASRSANARSRGTCARGGPAGRAGQRFYETTPTRSGLATFCKPKTCSSARSSRSCSSSSPAAKSCSPRRHASHPRRG